MSSAADAISAVSYTQRVLGTLPSNHPIKRIVTMNESLVCVGGVRRTAAVARIGDVRDIRRIAATAKAANCGNCGEYAAVAFDYLLLTGCTYDIEYALYEAPGDHAFVIVGRPPATDSSKPASWGPDVVVCDAWKGEVISAADYWVRMPSFPNAVHAPVIRLRHPDRRGDYPDVLSSTRPA